MEEHVTCCNSVTHRCVLIVFGQQWSSVTCLLIGCVDNSQMLYFHFSTALPSKYPRTCKPSANTAVTVIIEIPHEHLQTLNVFT